MIGSCANHEGATVLVADDDAASRLVAGTALQGAGFRVIEASNGEEAIELFRSGHPQIVLLDVVMPVMDGFQACAEIRSLPGGQDTPILMLTGLEDVESINRAYEVGATDFATKPIPWAILVHRVRYMLRSRSFIDALRESETRLAAAQQIARLANWELDLDTGMVRISEEVRGLFGLPAGSSITDLSELLPYVHPEDRELTRHAVEEMSRGREFECFDFRIALPDGAVRHIHHQARLIQADTGRAARLAGTFQDITPLRAAEERVRFLAHYDELTQLPNRFLFMDRIKLAISNAHRSNRHLAVLFLDLDRFKRINDTMGHSAGDGLLGAVAGRLRTCVRNTDTVARQEEAGAGSTVARFGGDEFIVLLPELNRGVDAARVARRILDALEAPFILDGHEVASGGSIGISLFPNDGQDAETLLKNADMAMYQAKESGRGCYQFYTESMNAVAFQRLSMEGSLRRALVRNEFTLYFQPQVDIAKESIFGTEALIRWRHPELGLVAPADFIPVAEETGLIVPIGEWVLRSACVQAKAWEDAGLGPLSVSVNVSSQQFWQPNFVASVAASLEAAKLPASSLELEITESVLMRTKDETVRTLNELRKMGLRISIDDFGTGYSSLSYLRRFPVSSLKIDRSFIRRIATDVDDASLVGAILTMARSLKVEAVAEGVETREQLEALRGLGCRFVQGFLFAEPAPPERIDVILRNPRELVPFLVGASA